MSGLKGRSLRIGLGCLQMATKRYLAEAIAENESAHSVVQFLSF